MSAHACATGFVAILASSLLLTAATQAQSAWYVDDDADPNGDGITWNTAFSDLQDALDAATYGDEVRVAGGVYVPSQPTSPNDPRTATFELISGVGMYGGYAGLADPNHPDGRDIELYETILSGDLAGDDEPEFGNYDDNSYHVVKAVGATTVLNGFTIAGGYADADDWPNDMGGGMHSLSSSCTVIRCTFANNFASYGGGMFYGWVCNATLTQCVFRGNLAAHDGGGLYNETYGTLTNCIFSNNQARRGGAMFNWGADNYCGDCLTLTRCIFVNNSATSPYDTGAGGAIANFDWGQYGFPTGGEQLIRGCIFTGNSAESNGGAIDNACHSASFGPEGYRILSACTLSGNSAGGSGNAISSDIEDPIAFNGCVLWDGGNEIWDSGHAPFAVSYSDVEGGWPGEGNINEDPMFADGDGGDVHLRPGSPCINAGDPNYVAEAGETDWDGQPRIVYGRVDMGADEYLCLGDLDGDGLVGLLDLATLLDNYHSPAGVVYEDGDLDGDGDVDLSDLAELLGHYGDTCE